VEVSTRERLTGALLVVLALVIVVPELLSGHRPAAQGIPPAQNPEDGAPLQTYDVQLDPSGAARAAPRDEPAAAAAQLAAVPPPVTRDAPPPVTPAPAPPAAPAAVAPPVEAPRAAEAGASATAAPGKWWVQLGTFASRDNAQRLAQKLRAAGFTIELAQTAVKGKELYRVRAGPVADRGAAGDLQARLAAAGEKKSSLVPP